jgi:hypothetical protein
MFHQKARTIRRNTTLTLVEIKSKTKAMSKLWLVLAISMALILCIGAATKPHRFYPYPNIENTVTHGFFRCTACKQSIAALLKRVKGMSHPLDAHDVGTMLTDFCSQIKGDYALKIDPEGDGQQTLAEWVPVGNGAGVLKDDWVTHHFYHLCKGRVRHVDTQMIMHGLQIEVEHECPCPGDKFYHIDFLEKEDMDDDDREDL